MSVLSGGGPIAKKAGVFGSAYNRTNFKFDQGQRWSRYTAGRKFAIAQVGMFREDVADLASTAANKLKSYGGILALTQTVCVTVYVEGRSGLKFPGPPTFVSGIYLQCLGIGFAMATLAQWLVFHSANRAAIMACQLRTRKVRLPVPTQRQLDGARKILSSYEEQNLYDIFKIPLVMPNVGESPNVSDEEIGKLDKTTASDQEIVASKHRKQRKAERNRERGEGDGAVSEGGYYLPALTKGNPTWIDKEMTSYEFYHNASPGTNGRDGPVEPFEHFEWVRNVQREYWAGEAYSRVCFLYAMMHLILAFAYWLVLHNICELAMVWCAIISGAALTSGVWLMFRLDVLPDHGGCLPIEAGGPFITAIALSLLYNRVPSQAAINAGRAVSILIIIMHIVFTFRLYAIAMPGGGTQSNKSRESGGRLFNESGNCDKPTWLPSAFQHVGYLVAPPLSRKQKMQGSVDRDDSKSTDPMHNVDMTPWYYTRAMLFFILLGWFVLLTGRIVECEMGERMLVSNPGSPPWTRIGQWYGWESGPISSKHYAHVTPQRGHYAWQRGWGPQGQQELWASDLFGFAPEADAWWAEDGEWQAAGVGENTWTYGFVNYPRFEAQEKKKSGGHPYFFDPNHEGGHRRLDSSVMALPAVVRPVVPAAIQWPALFEPELIVCGPSDRGQSAIGPVVVLSSSGSGALVPAAAASGQQAATAVHFALEGFMDLGLVHSVTWARSGLLVVTQSGAIASCPSPSSLSGRSQCSPVQSPRLPMTSPDAQMQRTLAVVVESPEEAPLRAALMSSGVNGRISILEVQVQEGDDVWREVAQLLLPEPFASEGEKVAAITATAKHLTITSSNGRTYQWKLKDGRPMSTSPSHELPSAGSDRTFHSACAMPGGRIARLASKWQRAADAMADLTWHPELLL